jgi:hypothetical protein
MRTVYAAAAVATLLLAGTALAATCAADGSSATISIATSGSDRVITTNGCPNHAHRAINPNTAQTQTFFGAATVTVPTTPYLASSAHVINATCLPGAIGFAVTGVSVYSPFPGTCGGDAVKLEADTFDECAGHAERTGMYHYHMWGTCLNTATGASATAHGPIGGYMIDGIPFYGPRGDNGTLPTDLDSCGGHASDSGNNGNYHYHFQPSAGTLPEKATPFSAADAAAAGAGFPYTAGCLKGCIPDAITLEGGSSKPYSSYAICTAAGTAMTNTESVTVTYVSTPAPSTATPSGAAALATAAIAAFVAIAAVVV